MCSRIIAAYLALCVGDRNIIDMLIKADNGSTLLCDNPSINDIGFRILINVCILQKVGKKT